MKKPSKADSNGIRQAILDHWREVGPNDRITHLVRVAQRLCGRALQVRLAEEGVPLGHWDFLRILWQRDGFTQRELAIRAGVMASTAFVALQSMEQLGYITRKRAPNNNKNVYVHLTRKGRALEKKLTAFAEDANRVALLGFEPHEIAAGRKLLMGVIENLANDGLGPRQELQAVAITAKRSGA